MIGSALLGAFLIGPIATFLIAAVLSGVLGWEPFGQGENFEALGNILVTGFFGGGGLFLVAGIWKMARQG